MNIHSKKEIYKDFVLCPCRSPVWFAGGPAKSSQNPQRPRNSVACAESPAQPRDPPQFFSRYSAFPTKLNRKTKVFDRAQFRKLDTKVVNLYNSFRKKYEYWKRQTLQPVRCGNTLYVEKELARLFEEIERTILYFECVQFEPQLLQIPEALQVSSFRHVKELLSSHPDLDDIPLTTPLGSHQISLLKAHCYKLRTVCNKSEDLDHTFEIIPLLSERHSILKVRRVLLVVLRPKDLFCEQLSWPSKRWWNCIIFGPALCMLRQFGSDITLGFAQTLFCCDPPQTAGLSRMFS